MAPKRGWVNWMLTTKYAIPWDKHKWSSSKSLVSLQESKTKWYSLHHRQVIRCRQHSDNKSFPFPEMSKTAPGTNGLSHSAQIAKRLTIDSRLHSSGRYGYSSRPDAKHKCYMRILGFWACPRHCLRISVFSLRWAKSFKSGVTSKKLSYSDS